jgi:hypothetical protein
MDDPVRFADELSRVSRAGYVQSPSEIAERLFHWSFHRWYVNRVDDVLVLHPRDPDEPFGEFFDYLYEYNPAYYYFQRSMPDLFWVELEWRDRLHVEVRDTSPLPLRDPVALRRLVQPRLSLFGQIRLFITTLMARSVRAETRRRLRSLFGRSYV